MRVLDGVTCGDDYTEAATIQYVYGSSGGYMAVTANDVYCQLQYGDQGQEVWTDELHVPIGSGVLFANTIGIRFRNYTPGSNAVVSAALSSPQEPSLAIGAGGVATPSTGGAAVIGEVIFYAGPTPDATKYLFCDGSAVSRSTYADLFAAIGTTWGIGDGVTTFNLPDMQGRMPVGLAAVGGQADVTTLGNDEGAPLADRRPKHKHSLIQATGAAGTSAYPSSNKQSTSTATGTGSVGPQANTPVDSPAYAVLGAWICFAT